MNNVCPVCKTSYPPDVQFCINDGTKLGVPINNPFEQKPKLEANPFSPPAYNPFESQSDRTNPFTKPLPVGQPYPKASLGNRFLAALIDGLIIIGLLIPGGALLIFAFIAAYGSDEGLAITLGVIGVLAVLCLPIAYMLFKDGFGQGQSYGKKALGLVVVDLDTYMPCGKAKSLARNIVSTLVGMFPLVGQFVEPIMVIATEDGRKLGDRAANTMVVDSVTYFN